MKKNIIGLLVALSLIVISAEAAKKVNSECVDNSDSLQSQNIKSNKKITFINNSGDKIRLMTHLELKEKGKTKQGVSGELSVNAHAKFIVPYCFSGPQGVTFVKDCDYLLDEVLRPIEQEVDDRINDSEFLEKNYPQYKKSDMQGKEAMINGIAKKMYEDQLKGKVKKLNIADTLKKLSRKKSFNLVITISDMNTSPVVEIKK